MSNKPKRITTPKGIAKFPALVTPDEYKGKENYKVHLLLDPEQSDGLERAIEETIEVAKGQAQAQAKKKRKRPVESNRPYGEDMKPIKDDDGEITDWEPTGYTEFKCKSTASGVKNGKAWRRKLPMFDSKGKPIQNPPEIRGGAELKLSLTLIPWVNEKLEYGCKLQLEAVQVLSVGGFVNRSAEDYGFGEEEGFDADEVGGDDDTPPWSQDDEAPMGDDSDYAPVGDEDDDF